MNKGLVLHLKVDDGWGFLVDTEPHFLPYSSCPGFGLLRQSKLRFPSSQVFWADQLTVEKALCKTLLSTKQRLPLDICREYRIIFRWEDFCNIMFGMCFRTTSSMLFLADRFITNRIVTDRSVINREWMKRRLEKQLE